MDAGQPRVRRRGFFFHVEPDELDPVEHDAAEGLSVRPGPSRKATHAVRTGSSVASAETKSQPHTVGLRSANATEIRQPVRTRR